MSAVERSFSGIERDQTRGNQNVESIWKKTLLAGILIIFLQNALYYPLIVVDIALMANSADIVIIPTFFRLLFTIDLLGYAIIGTSLIGSCFQVFDKRKGIFILTGASFVLWSACSYIWRYGPGIFDFIEDHSGYGNPADYAGEILPLLERSALFLAIAGLLFALMFILLVLALSRRNVVFLIKGITLILYGIVNGFVLLYTGYYFHIAVPLARTITNQDLLVEMLEPYMELQGSLIAIKLVFFPALGILVFWFIYREFKILLSADEMATKSIEESWKERIPVYERQTVPKILQSRTRLLTKHSACSSCNEIVEQGDLFCMHCGAKLKQN